MNKKVMRQHQFFSYFWPAVAGLLLATLILVRTGPPVGTQSTEATSGGIASLSGGGWEGPVSYAQAVKRAAPSVVNIYTSKTVQQANPLLGDPFFRRYFGNTLPQSLPEQQNSLGSGVIISSDGYILTNQHVIADADQIVILLADGRQSSAEIIGVDAETDLAVLQVPLRDLPAISLGDPNSADVGDVVLAIGNPFGVGQTVTQGIISATGRNFMDLSRLVNFIQTDAAINQGNSGGALIDAYGNLIGINTRVLQNSGAVGVGFATPSDIAIKVVEDIVGYGHVVRGWVGIEARQLSPELAEASGADNPRAMVVTGLYPGGPAHRAGIEAGDILTALNDRPISDGRQVLRQIVDTPPGERLTFDILRNGEKIQVIAQADARPEANQ